MNDQVYWKNRWKNNQIGWHEPLTHPLLIALLPKLNMKKGDTIFLPFCGASVDMLYLAQQGYNVIGSEISNIACERFFAEQNLHYQINERSPFLIYENDLIHLYCGDYFSLTTDFLPVISAVYDRAGLVALAESERKNYAIHLQNLIPINRNILLITMTYENERNEPPYLVTEHELFHLYNENYCISMLGQFDDTPVCQHLLARKFINPVEHAYLIRRKL